MSIIKENEESLNVILTFNNQWPWNKMPAANMHGESVMTMIMMIRLIEFFLSIRSTVYVLDDGTGCNLPKSKFIKIKKLINSFWVTLKRIQGILVILGIESHNASSFVVATKPSSHPYLNGYICQAT